MFFNIKYYRSKRFARIKCLYTSDLAKINPRYMSDDVT